MTQVGRFLKTPTASNSEFGCSKGVSIMGRNRPLQGSCKQRRLSIERMGLWATILFLGGAAAVLEDKVASADEAITKGLRLMYLVTEDERTLAIWGPGVSEEPAEVVTDNKVLLPVPARMVAEIQAIVSNPAGFPDGTFEYALIFKGGSSTAVCHTQNGQFHCHPPS